MYKVTANHSYLLNRNDIVSSEELKTHIRFLKYNDYTNISYIAIKG